MHGLNRVIGLEDNVSSRVFSDSSVSGVAEKIATAAVFGRCCDGDDGTKPWIGSAHDTTAKRKVVSAFVMIAWFMISNQQSSCGRNPIHLEVKYVFCLYV